MINHSSSSATCGENCAEVYGNLYNWYAVNDYRDICPENFHVPSDDEWKILEKFLGMNEWIADSSVGWRGTNEGSKLANNSYLWNGGFLKNNSEFGTSGFNAIPGGYRGVSEYIYEGYYAIGESCYFWSRSMPTFPLAWARLLSNDRPDVWKHQYNFLYGFSVRCLKD